MNLPYVLISSVVVLVLVLAIVREVRLRRALHKLLGMLLTLWRNRSEITTSSVDRDPDPLNPGGL